MFAVRSARQAGRTRKLAKGATLIAESTTIVGDLHFDDQLFVNGRIDGNVTADPDGGATLVISDVGCVKGEIRAPYVVINGAVDGDVHAHARVELAGNAVVTGNVYYELIEMQLGARVDGQLVHVERAPETATVHSLPAPQQDEPATPRSVLKTDG
jgi:cytoskeletal protein CcmA (bactofilin family)